MGFASLKTCKSVGSLEEFSGNDKPKIDYDFDFSNFEKVFSVDKLIAILKRGI